MPKTLTTLVMTVLLTALMALSSPSVAADFTGTWVLDRNASDSLDEVLKARGVGWLQRKAMAKLVVTQTITQSGDELTIETTASSKRRTDTLTVDGATRTVEHDKGTAQVRHEWRGEDLVSTSAMAGGDGTMTTRRSLSEDGKTMTQQLTLQTADGATHVANRVFRKS